MDRSCKDELFISHPTSDSVTEVSVHSVMELTVSSQPRGGKRAYPAALCLPSCAGHHVDL